MDFPDAHEKTWHEAPVTLYFPVETIHRELDFRIALGALLAERFGDVVIAHAGFLNSALSVLNSGTYVGKNLFVPHHTEDLALLDRARSRGLRVVHLDEEGAVFPGREEDWRAALDTRLDPMALGKNDALCTWGSFQAEHYRSKLSATPNSPRVEITGHPRFDMYKKGWRSYFDRAAAELRESYGEYILVNTNLARANHAEGLERVFSGAAGYRPQQPDATEAFMKRWVYYRAMHANLLELIHAIARDAPKRNVIVRPHPSEDVGSYKVVLAGLSNVHVLRKGPVAPWIFGAQAVVHDGCTTAIEAAIAGCHVVRFAPVAKDDEFVDRFLPNAFGTTARSIDEVLQAIRAPQTDTLAAGLLAKTNGGTMPTDLLYNLQDSSFEKLVTVIEQTSHAARSSLSAESNKGIFALAKKYRATEIAKYPLRKSTSRRRKMFQHAFGKFAGFEENDVAERVREAAVITGQRVKIRRMNAYCIELGRSG